MSIYKDNKLYFEYLIAFILFYFTNAFSSIFGYIAFALLSLFIVFGDNNTSIKWVLFLLPNIRVLDALELTYFVNVLLILASIKIIFFQYSSNGVISLNTRFSLTALSATIFIFIYEVIHAFLNPDSLSSIIFNAGNVAFDYFVLLRIAEGSYSHSQFKSFNYSLIMGVFTSISVFLMANPSIINMIISSAYRLGAYGTDPNYLSVYIVVSMAVLAMMSFYISSTFIDILFFIILFIAGLLTVSKMCIICMLILISVYIIIALWKSNNKRIQSVFIRLIPVLIIVSFFLKNSILVLWQKFLDRFAGTINISAIDQYSSGRSDIFQFYLNHFFDSFVSCLFGRGINYLSYYQKVGAMFVSHNTYFDFLLSWGFVGCILVSILSYKALKKNLKGKHEMIAYFPLGMMLIMLFSLSCMSSDMFWYLLAFVIIPIKLSSSDGLSQEGIKSA